MSALVLGAGAFVAVDRDDRSMLARLRVTERHGVELRSNAMVVAQVWRDPASRQAQLARLLTAVDVRPVEQADGRAAGVLLAAAGGNDVVDATVALLAGPGDRILTGDAKDMRQLAEVAGKRAIVVAC